MALSIVDLYTKALPKTNCKECGFSTCMAFASMVVSEKHPLKNCPYIKPELLEDFQKELEEQYKAGKWLKKDPAQDALNWAKERAASMKLDELPQRIGGELKTEGQTTYLELPYFNDWIIIKEDSICKKDKTPLNRWEQVFIYNHMAQGGSVEPVGKWKGLVEFPNTVSKVKSMKEHIEEPLIEFFSGKTKDLLKAGLKIGGKTVEEKDKSADVALLFKPLPKIPVMLMFWDGEEKEEFQAQVKLLFDETIVQHLDIESILFLSERLKQLLCEE